MQQKMNESVAMLNILMNRAKELLDVEGEEQALKRTVKVKHSNTVLGYWRRRNAAHADLKQLLKQIRKESIKLEKLMKAVNDYEGR